MLVVVAIIGILAAIVLSALNSARAKARDARRDSDIKTIQNALETYYVEHGEYPVTSWQSSNKSSQWSNLESLLGQKLPVDPINETGARGEVMSEPYKLFYAYFSHSNPDYCSGQAYMLVYNKETADGSIPNDGVRFCDGILRSYGKAFVAGMSPRQ